MNLIQHIIKGIAPVFNPALHWYSDEAEYIVKEVHMKYNGQTVQTKYQVWIKTQHSEEPAMYHTRLTDSTVWNECEERDLIDKAEEDLRMIHQKRAVFFATKVYQDAIT